VSAKVVAAELSDRYDAASSFLCMEESTMKRTSRLSILASALWLLPVAALGQFQGIPASDQLGVEDIWGNPTFVGGVVNGGPTAHSEW